MKLLIAMEGRFIRVSNGVYSTHLTYSRLWSRYTEVFEAIIVLARVSHRDTVPQGWEKADGPRVEFCDLPDYYGVRGYLRKRNDIVRIVRQAAWSCDGALLRVPGLVSTLAWQELRRIGCKYALEVVGDPFEALMHTSLPLPLRIVAAQIGAQNLRRQCREAAGAAYVTERALQARYPSGGIEAFFSDVELSWDSFVDDSFIRERCTEWKMVVQSRSRAWRIAFIGSLAQPYKGLGVLLRALSICSQRGVDWHLRVVGDGRLRVSYEQLAKRLGISAQVEFLGRLPAGRSIIQQLDWSDIFVLPSYTEGMPRALLEAMARGLPCISTPVGGIPELLSGRVLVPRGRSDLLANTICAVFGLPGLMEDLAMSNRERAKKFEITLLSHSRRQFYTSVKELLGKTNTAFTISGTTSASSVKEESTLQ